jgi:hypothetical protein
MKRIFLLAIICILLIAPAGWLARTTIFARQSMPTNVLATTGSWSSHNDDLVYIVAFSSQRQPDGPLIVYRASSSNLQDTLPIISIARGPQAMTPLLFPSPDGQYLALLTPLRDSADTSLNGAVLRLFSSDGHSNTLLVPGGVAYGDQPVWSPDGRYIYYHTGTAGLAYNQTPHQTPTREVSTCRDLPCGGLVGRCQAQCGYDEIERVDLSGHITPVYSEPQSNGSLRLVGTDRAGELIMSLARPGKPVELLAVQTNASQGLQASRSLFRLAGQPKETLQTPIMLPADILPGNVLGMGDNGTSVLVERVLSEQPLRYTTVSISLANGAISNITPLFETAHYGIGLTPLNRSSDGRVLVMSQVMSVRQDLATQGISGVPAQEALVLADAKTGATQTLRLPTGGQIVQAFWTAHEPLAHIQVHVGSQGVMSAHPIRYQPFMQNASVFQQDEWMLEGHAGILADAPVLSKMCYGTCPQGAVGAPHVSAAILHGIGYVETNWHQFNTSSYDVNGEPIGSPVESFDGGWGQYQQTWGMPPQCVSANNCRSDVAKVENDQSYNIGTGVSALISAWNGTAGVASNSDPNDPYKANDWFFAVWAYNGAYGNNPNDIPSSQYAHWYPGAPFRSIYEEYVWYFAAHQQYSSNGFTDNYISSLGTSLLPPQSDFTNTNDSFVSCITCTIPDWTSGTYDREWVGSGAPDGTIAGYFTATFNTNGGEDTVGLPRDNGGGAAVHSWNAGLSQDFGGGSAQPGAILLASGSQSAYWVYGGVWTQYLTVDKGTGGCHGYPTSALTPYSDPGLGSDSYYQQTFQTGSIIWDATLHKVAQDVC